METYFEVRTQYEKIGEDGESKKVTETYLANAISCTDSELKVTQEIQPYSNGEFKVVNIREMKIAQLFERNVEGHWYACRLAMVTILESGKEKRIPVLIYVKAVDVNDAEEFVMLQLKQSMADWVVVSVTESKVIDVFM